MRGNFNTLEDVIALARFAHSKQRDKAGMAYFEHPYRVMQAVQAQGAMPYVQMAAVLHDVTEDTPFTPQMLLDFGVPEAAVAIVILLDRNLSKKSWQHSMDELDAAKTSWSGLGPNEFERAVDNLILRGNLEGCLDANSYYYKKIRKSEGALMVKLADIHDNTQQWRLSYLPQDTQDRLHKKYAKAKEMLLS